MAGRVIVLGGGVAGMSAAHELIERGFEVVVLERRDIAGGKARSVPVIRRRRRHERTPARRQRREIVGHRLPGEHGFRFFPGFYKHVIDTMRRIPSFDGRKVADHLVPTTRVGITQYGKPNFSYRRSFHARQMMLAQCCATYSLRSDRSPTSRPDDFAFFGARIWQILTSCEQRRLAEYERTSWWEFVGAEQRSESYQKFLAQGITRSLVAAKARKASTRTIGDIFVQLMLTILNPTGGSTDRVLDGPTNLVWIDPWRTYLESRGVRYVTEAEVEEILCERGRIAGVAVRQRGQAHGRHRRPLRGRAPARAHCPDGEQPAARRRPGARQSATAGAERGVDERRAVLSHRDVPTAHGHVIHIDTEWALTSVSQLQFWRNVPPEQFGDSDVRGIFSVDVSDWTAPGSDGRPAIQCSREEVVRETWQQLKRSINVDEELLRDEDLHSWFLDPDIESDPAHPGFLRMSSRCW